MAKYFLLIILSTASFIIIAKESHFIREYTYRASDSDSKISARQSALQQLKAGVLEEVVTYIHSTSQLSADKQGVNTSQVFNYQVNSIAVGAMKSVILAEKWDGETFYLKAKISLDPEQVKQALAKQIENPNTSIMKVQTSDSEKAHTSSLLAPTADYSHFVLSAELAQVISLLMPLKMSMQHYKMMRGDWPKKLSEMGFSSAEMKQSGYIEQVKLDNTGGLYAVLAPKFGVDKLLKLSFTSSMGGTSLVTICQINISKKVASQSHLCEYNDRLSYP